MHPDSHDLSQMSTEQLHKRRVFVLQEIKRLSELVESLKQGPEPHLHSNPVTEGPSATVDSGIASQLLFGSTPQKTVASQACSLAYSEMTDVKSPEGAPRSSPGPLASFAVENPDISASFVSAVPTSIAGSLPWVPDSQPEFENEKVPYSATQTQKEDVEEAEDDHLTSGVSHLPLHRGYSLTSMCEGKQLKLRALLPHDRRQVQALTFAWQQRKLAVVLADIVVIWEYSNDCWELKKELAFPSETYHCACFTDDDQHLLVGGQQQTGYSNSVNSSSSSSGGGGGGGGSGQGFIRLFQRMEQSSPDLRWLHGPGAVHQLIACDQQCYWSEQAPLGPLSQWSFTEDHGAMLGRGKQKQLPRQMLGPLGGTPPHLWAQRRVVSHHNRLYIQCDRCSLWIVDAMSSAVITAVSLSHIPLGTLPFCVSQATPQHGPDVVFVPTALSHTLPSRPPQLTVISFSSDVDSNSSKSGGGGGLLHRQVALRLQGRSLPNCVTVQGSGGLLLAATETPRVMLAVVVRNGVCGFMETKQVAEEEEKEKEKAYQHQLGETDSQLAIHSQEPMLAQSFASGWVALRVI
jgi:hypothetical protein